MVEENMNSAKFADEIGIINSRLSHYLSGRNNVSLDLITRILERFRGINSEWLLFGRGEMYKSADVKMPNRELDLFSSSQIASEPSTQNEAEKFDISTTDSDIFDPEPLMQGEKQELESDKYNDSQSVVSVNKAKNSRAEIEKIIVMYSDSTFDCYLPNGQKV